MSCTNCMNRRGFLAKSAIAAAALVVAEGCGDGQIGPPIRDAGGGDPNLPFGPPVTVRLSDFPALATVGAVVDIGHERAVVRTGETTFRGLSRVCTHQQCDTEVQGDRFVCPCHGSTFASDGSVIHGPSIASPPITPLRMLDVTVDAAAGTITVA